MPWVPAPTGIRALSGRAKLVNGHGRRLFVHCGSRRGQEPIDLGAIDEDAAREAQHDDVEADRKPRPQMNLEDRSAKPHSLRLAQPSSHDDHSR